MSGNADLTSFTRDRAHYNRVDIQGHSNQRSGLRPTLVREYRRAGGHTGPAQLRKLGNQFFGHAIGERFFFRSRGSSLEWQHRNRLDQRIGLPARFVALTHNPESDQRGDSQNHRHSQGRPPAVTADGNLRRGRWGFPDEHRPGRFVLFHHGSRLNPLDRIDEAIAVLRHRLDKAGVVGGVAQRGTDLFDRCIKTEIKIHKGICGPDLTLQFFAGHQLTRIGKQKGKYLEWLVLEGDPASALTNLSLMDVYFIDTKTNYSY